MHRYTNLSERLQAINWSAFAHAYGPATDIPEHIHRLFGGNEDAALAALHYLDASLCYQHIGVASALVPAMPFLFECIPLLSTPALVALLELFWGVASVTNPPDPFLSIRPLDLAWTSIPSAPLPKGYPETRALRRYLITHRSVFVSFLQHPDEVFELALLILSTFADVPDGAVAALLAAAATERDPTRRASLYAPLKVLPFEGKVQTLLQAFAREDAPLPRAVLAGQIALDLRSASPPDVVTVLTDQLLSESWAEHEIQHRSVPWSDGFFPDLGIPLALSRPEHYQAILGHYMRLVEQHPFMLSCIAPAAIFLAFAFRRNTPIDVRALRPDELRAITLVAQANWRGNTYYPGSDAYSYFGLPTTREGVERLLRSVRPM